MALKDLGSRHGGLLEWLLQRATAVFMLAFVPAMLVYFWLNPVTGFADWQARMSQLWMQLAWLLFVLALLVHGWAGVKSVLMDYVHPLGLRMALYFLFLLAFVLEGLWALDIFFGGGA